MKKLKRLVFASLLLCGHVYGMNPLQVMVKTFMIPEHQELANDELFELLDSAKEEVLVSMYWITDDFVVDRLIEVGKRGVNLEVIFDESCQNRDTLLEKFVKNHITPIIFPSEFTETLMHNKFLVIDGSKVWTGSANFTKKAFDPTSERFNHENVVVIDSKEVAENYSDGFNNVKEDAVNSYIQLFEDHDMVPDYVKQLGTILYREDQGFKQAIKEQFRTATPAQRNRLQNYFSVTKEIPTDKQRYFLQVRGLFRDGMSFEEASQLIGEIKKQGRGAANTRKNKLKAKTAPPSRQKPSSKWQKDFLEDHGINPKGMSYDEAYRAIAQLKH